MPQAKTEVALQISECCAAEVALQHSLYCGAEVIFTKCCAATSEKLQCNIENAALQESGAFLPLSCGFQAPTFRHPRLGPAEIGTASHIAVASRDPGRQAGPLGLPKQVGIFSQEGYCKHASSSFMLVTEQKHCPNPQGYPSGTGGSHEMI